MTEADVLIFVLLVAGMLIGFAIKSSDSNPTSAADPDPNASPLPPSAETEGHLDVDIQRTCVDCGQEFWWNLGEQGYFARRGLRSPKRCGSCRGRKKFRTPLSARTGQTADSLVRQPAARLAVEERDLPERATQFVNRAELFADLQQLLTDATAPVVARRRTFFEWLSDIDPVAAQLAKKFEAATTADELVRQRTVLLEHLEKMLIAVTNAEVARMDAQVKLLQKQLQVEQLQEQLKHRRHLSQSRLQTRQLEEQVSQQKLHEAVDDDGRAGQQHRRRRRAHAAAKRDVLSDFLHEIELICKARVSLHEKALRMRDMLAVFEMGEDSLPEDARWILTAGERSRHEA